MYITFVYGAALHLVLCQHFPLVGSAGILWSFELDFESLHTNLESIHGLNSSLGTGWIIKAHKSEAFALICRSVNEDFGADYVSKRQEHLHQLSVSKLLGKVVNEEVAT